MNFKDIILSYIPSKEETENNFLEYSKNKVFYCNGKLYTGDNIKKYRGEISFTDLLEDANMENLQVIESNNGLLFRGRNFSFEKILPYPSQLIETITYSMMISGQFNDGFRIGLRNNQNGGLYSLFEFNKNNSKFILINETVEDTDYVETTLQLSLKITQNVEMSNYKIKYKLESYDNDNNDWVNVYTHVRELTLNDLDYSSYSIVMFHDGTDADSYVLVKSLNCNYNDVGGVTTNLSLNAPSWILYDASNPLTVTATLTDVNNNPLHSQKIILYKDGEFYLMEKTNENGVATFNIKVRTDKSINIQAFFDEEGIYDSSYSTVKTVAMGVDVSLTLDNINISD